MGRSGRTAAVASLVVAALGVSAVGPCHCLVDVAACHREVQEADAHACCEKPVGVQAESATCCDSDPEPVLVSVDVPEVTPPTLRSSPIESSPPAHRSAPLAGSGPFPPPALDRNTVLLI